MPPSRPFSHRAASLARTEQTPSRGPVPGDPSRYAQRKPIADAPPPTDRSAPQDGARTTAALAHCGGWRSCFTGTAAPDESNPP